MIMPLVALLLQVPPPPPPLPQWVEEEQPVQMKGAEWMVGKSVDEVRRQAKRGTQFENTHIPTNFDSGITDIQTTTCNIVLYTKPYKLAGLLVWKVHGFSKHWLGLVGADAELCSKSVRSTIKGASKSTGE